MTENLVDTVPVVARIIDWMSFVTQTSTACDVAHAVEMYLAPRAGPAALGSEAQSTKRRFTGPKQHRPMQESA